MSNGVAYKDKIYCSGHQNIFYMKMYKFFIMKSKYMSAFHINLLLICNTRENTLNLDFMKIGASGQETLKVLSKLQ